MIQQLKYDAMLAYVRNYHEGQVRNKTHPLPYWTHCYGVATITRDYLERYLPNDDHTDVVLAALGHDLYEDTEATRDEVSQLYGQTVDDYIFGLTNEHSDADRDAYMAKMLISPEAVIIVKMADMIENMQSVYYNIDLLGAEFLDEFFMPIMNDSMKVIETYDRYETYQVVAASMLAHAKLNYALLAGIAQQGV